jgi:glycyl-tRNA synthetase beta chain
VAEVLERTIRDFPWPKSMRWGSGSLRWVRPLHSILCLLTDEAGAEVVPLEVDGIRAGDTTAGHRFMAPGRFSVTGFDDLRREAQARPCDPGRPRNGPSTSWHDATQHGLRAGAGTGRGPGLLAEVAGLVEWPVVLMGEIGEASWACRPRCCRPR